MRAGSRGTPVSLFSRAGCVTSAAWVVVLMVSWLWSGEAWANSAPLPVSFDASGQALPQAEIRVAIGTELGREARTEEAVGDENRERVVVAVDELGQLWVRYWGPRGLVDRHLTMPARPEQVPLVVSLSVGNLVRQEAFELLRDLERRRAQAAKPSESAPSAAPTSNASPPSSKPPAATLVPQPSLPRRASPPRAPAYAKRKSSWGHYLVGDFAYFPTVANACAATSDTPCYDRDFAPITFDVEGTGVAGGIVPADARYVMAYAHQLGPQLWGSARVGLAFSGGKAKNAAAKQDFRMSKFMPWLVELRLQYFIGQGALGGALRPFVHAAGGLAEVSADVKLSAPLGPDGRLISDRGPMTAIRAMGLLFAGGGLGLSLELFEHMRAETELSGFLAFPSYGWFARPSIGLTYDF
jgi:hypothetical protein